jgi:hypothetical protein
MNHKDFVNPSADDRLLPFWIWNGTIEENEIVRQIREMSEKGIGGFCLATGPGLKTPHLSQVWFDRVQLALDTAAGCGLHVWIHDEYRYPGGIGSTHITLDRPQFVAQQLTFRETVVQGGQQVDLILPWAPVLQALAVPLRRDRCLWEDTQDISAYLGANHQSHVLRENTGLPTYHPYTYASLDPVRRLYWKAPAGRWRVLVFLQEPSATTDWAGPHLDRFNPESVRTLHQTAQQPYVEQFSNYTGKTLKGILTGETLSPNDRLPWSPVLSEYFKARNEYDLLACLPALITNFGPNTARIRYDYFQTLGELQQRHDIARSAEWCSEHQLDYACNATPMRNAHRASIPTPGVSGGRAKVGIERARGYVKPTVSYRHSPGFAAALAAQAGATRVHDTCFQNTGWALTLQDMKAQLDALGVQGTNFFVPHGFYYTLDGLRKHATPPSQFHQNPYWKHFRLLSDYAGRLAHVLRKGQQVADIAVLDPVTSLWSHLSHPLHDWSYVGYDSEEESLANHLVADWAYITDAIQQMQRPMHSLDPTFLAQARVVDGQLHVGNIRYKALVIPPITNLEREAFDILREFVNAGGAVIALGLLPIEDIQEGSSVIDGFSRLTDMDPSRMIRDYTGHELGVHLLRRDNFVFIRTGGTIAKNQAAYMLERLLDEMLPRQVHILPNDKNAKAIRYHHRTDGKHQIFFFINTSTSPVSTQVQLPVSGVQIEQWDLETGKRRPLSGENVGDHCTVHTTFDRLQSLLIVTTAGKNSPPEEITPESIDLDLKGAWKIDPEEDNALRLGPFKMQVDPTNRGVRQGWHRPAYTDGKWPKASPQPFAEQTERIVCWYRATFVADIVPTKLALVMDRSAIQGEYQVYINGSRLPSNAFRPTFRYDHANVTCSVGRRINKGKNVIAIRVEIDEPGDGLFDTIYLFGRFQVRSWRSLYLRLAPPQDRGPVFDLDAQGLPFYAGTVAYSRDITYRTLPKSEHFEISLERTIKNLTDVVEIQINGHSLGVRAWAPYTWVGETAWLKRGKNRVVFRVTNTLERLLTGMTFQPRTHKMMPIKI